MTDTVTILAQKRYCLHSHRLYMESIAINREDELFIWVLKADLACIVSVLSKSGRHGCWSRRPQGNIQGSTRKFLGHFRCYSGSQISSESSREKFATEKWVWSRMCLSVCVCAIDVWSRSSFRVTTCTLLPSWLSGMWVFFSIVHHTCHNWLFLF